MQEKSIEQKIEREIRRRLDGELVSKRYLMSRKNPINCSGGGMLAGYGNPNEVYKDEINYSSRIEFLVDKIKRPVISVCRKRNGGYCSIIDVVMGKFYIQMLNPGENSQEQQCKPAAYIEIKEVLELLKDERKIDEMTEERYQELLVVMG